MLVELIRKRLRLEETLKVYKDNVRRIEQSLQDNAKEIDDLKLKGTFIVELQPLYSPEERMRMFIDVKEPAPSQFVVVTLPVLTIELATKVDHAS